MKLDEGLFFSMTTKIVLDALVMMYILSVMAITNGCTMNLEKIQMNMTTLNHG